MGWKDLWAGKMTTSFLTHAVHVGYCLLKMFEYPSLLHILSATSPPFWMQQPDRLEYEWHSNDIYFAISKGQQRIKLHTA